MQILSHLVKTRPYSVLGAVAATLALGLYYVFVPLDIAGMNADRFETQITAFLLRGLVYFLPGAVVASGVFLLLRNWWAFVPAIAATLAAFYLWGYGLTISGVSGLLNGMSKVNITNPFGKYELAAVGGAGLVIALASWRFPRAIAAFLALLFVQLAALNAYSLVVNYHPPMPGVDNPKTAYRFSSRGNVITILFDGMQADTFARVLEDMPEVAEALDGFTFFKNAVSHAPSTFLSLPTIHSGTVPPTTGLQDYFEDNIRENSYLNDLAEHGYESSVLVNVVKRTCPEEAVYCGSYDRKGIDASERSVVNNLRAFRLMPFRAKKSPDHVGEKPEGTSPEFGLSPMIRAMWVDDGAPSAKLLHLYTTHPPFAMNPDCSVADIVDVTYDAALKQTKCAMRQFAQFIGKLKQLGVYDNTTFVVVADHGLGWPSDFASDEFAQKGAQDHALRALPNSYLSVFYRANPSLLVKPAQAHGPLKEDGRVVAISQVRATICTLTKDCDPGEAPSLLADNAEQKNIRFVAYDWIGLSWTDDQVPQPRVYSISGAPWKFSSWTPETAPAIALGQPAKVAVSGPFNTAANPPWSNMGWSYPEDGGTWTTDTNASLFVTVPAEAAGKPLLLTSQVVAYTDDSHPIQEVDVLVNGLWVDRWTFRYNDPERPLKTLLPAGLVRDRMRLDFVMHRPAAPKEIGEGAENRLLGINMRSFTVDVAKDVRPYALGEAVHLSNPASRGYLNRGWAAPEPWGSWIAGVQSQMVLPLGQKPEGDLVLRARIQGFVSTDHPSQDLHVVVNDKVLASYRFDAGHRSQDVALPVPADLLASGQAVVEFRAPNPGMLGGGVGEFSLSRE